MMDVLVECGIEFDDDEIFVEIQLLNYWATKLGIQKLNEETFYLEVVE